MGTRGWRAVVAATGLLVLAGCVALVGFLMVIPGSQEDAASLAQFLGTVLGVVALAVARQWRQEARARSLGNPEPMPVCWELTEPAIMDHPPLIAAGELSFTGRSDDIRSLTAEFRRLRRRRLVILGGPGTGKTTLAVQLLNELLATSQDGEPIPVLVSLAGWDPTEQSLHAWLATRLAEGYPSLRAFGPTTAQTLAEQGHLLPILDGLDELPESRQPEVIAALNESLTDTDQLVLTSRTTEYTTAITDAGSVLTSAAVIAPRPLTTAQAADYLEHCLPPEPGASLAGAAAPAAHPHRPTRATRSGPATRGSPTTCGLGLSFWPGDCTTPAPGTCTGGISLDTPSLPAYSG